MIIACMFPQSVRKINAFFTSGGSRISPRRGSQHTILPNFPKKLHEFERIWTPRGDARPKFYYVDPPLFTHLCVNSNVFMDLSHFVVHVLLTSLLIQFVTIFTIQRNVRKSMHGDICLHQIHRV